MIAKLQFRQIAMDVNLVFANFIIDELIINLSVSSDEKLYLLFVKDSS